MSGEKLIRLGGLAAIVAGVLRGVASFVPATLPELPLELLYFSIDILIMFGILGLYGFQHEEVGLWGFAGFVLSMVGIGIIIGPDGTISGISVYPVGSLIFAAGLVLLGVGSWKADRLPRWIPAL
jgi:hypothetical protein